MPAFPLADAHVHLWDPGTLRYPWLDSVPLLNRPYLLEDYRQACGAVRVARMVFVQCECEPAQSEREVAWVTELAARESRLAGMVAWAPLEHGEAARAALTRLARNPLVQGIRRILQFESDPAFCLRPDFIRGVQLLTEFDWGFDLCLKGPEQTANALALIRRCPGVRFILDHVGKPFIRERQLDPWRAQLKAFAALDNVWCKLSGLVVEADLERWQPEDLRPYVEHVVESFGIGRVMFGGDWPVVLRAAPWADWVATLDRLTAHLSREEARSLFHDNAVRFYRLDQPRAR